MDKDNLSYQFKQLGSYMATGASLDELGVSVEEVEGSSKYASSSSSSKVADHSTDRSLAKLASNLMKHFATSDDSVSSVICLEKTASTNDESWSRHDDEVVDTITKVAIAPLVAPVVAGGITLGTSFLANAPKLLSLGIPVVGSAGGRTLAAGEKSINEDDLDTELLKAKIIKYRILTAQLDRELNKRFMKQDSDDKHFVEIA